MSYESFVLFLTENLVIILTYKSQVDALFDVIYELLVDL